jgi:hypothetical protein
MKKSILFLTAFCLITCNTVNGQSGLLNKVTKSVTNTVKGKPQESSNNKNADQPEPACASDQAVVVMDMGGKLQLDYAELTISMLDDGSILAQHRGADEYYVVKNGVTTGPFKSGDPQVKAFDAVNEENVNKADPWLFKYKEYITKPGDKYLIKFGGKSYGSYAQINNFVVTKSKDKFAAVVIENVMFTQDDGDKMEKAMKNAKTDQEKMDLAMQYAQQMQDKMIQGGKPISITPKLITNIPNVTFDPGTSVGGTLDNNMKYDDILMNAGSKIMDLQGKTVLTLKPEHVGARNIYVNSSNTKYAVYDYGTLTFSDNTTMSDMFNLHLVKTDGKVYLAYMYYSPKRNSIMQHKIPF